MAMSKNPSTTSICYNWHICKISMLKASEFVADRPMNKVSGNTYFVTSQ